jgi:O-methyltransferase
MIFVPRLFDKLAHAASIAVIGTNVFSLSKFVEEVKDIPGDIVECGTYRGGSAIAMAVSTHKKVWCFDTFSGMPEVTIHDQHQKGDFTTTLDEVKRNVSDYQNIILVPGEFKDTIPEARIGLLALVYLDCDLYESYWTALASFWKQLSPGGILIAEDYPHESCLGAKRACNEFFGPDSLQFENNFWIKRK